MTTMNMTKAKCGHFVPAVGAPGSAARFACEIGPCQECDTPAFWQREYDEAVPIPVSPERIKEIVDHCLTACLECGGERIYKDVCTVCHGSGKRPRGEQEVRI
jgi:hypothetical protein